MPKVIEIRPNFSADSQYLFRLARAIEIDSDQPAEWRQRAMMKIYELIQVLAEANQRKIQEKINEL